MIAWVSVEERLPKDGQRVLTYAPEKFFGIDIHIFYENYGTVPGPWWIGVHNYFAAEGDVTHWQPLPGEPLEA